MPDLHGGVYHCTSQAAYGSVFDDEAKAVLGRIIWGLAGFSGLEVITYSVLEDYFHLLIRQPQLGEISDAELVNRLAQVYGPKALLTVTARQALAKDGQLDPKLRTGYLSRMGNLSKYMKELKQRLGVWYNSRHGRHGTLWAERYRVVLVEDVPGVLELVAGYVDLAPVRDGLVEDPKNYRFSGYGEASTGHKTARKGLLSISTVGVAVKGTATPAAPSWAEWSARYRQLMLGEAGDARLAAKNAMTPEQIQQTIADGGTLTPAQVLRVPMRQMTDGTALGSLDFVNEVYRINRHNFGAKRPGGAKLIPALTGSGLYSLRNHRGRTAANIDVDRPTSSRSAFLAQGLS